MTNTTLKHHGSHFLISVLELQLLNNSIPRILSLLYCSVFPIRHHFVDVVKQRRFKAFLSEFFLISCTLSEQLWHEMAFLKSCLTLFRNNLHDVRNVHPAIPLG